MKKWLLLISCTVAFTACSNKIEYNQLIKNNNHTIGIKDNAINVLTYNEVNQDGNTIINIDIYIDKYPYNKTFNLCDNTNPKCDSSINVRKKRDPEDTNIGVADLNFISGSNETNKISNVSHYGSYNSDIIIGSATQKNIKDSSKYIIRTWSLK